MKMIFSRRQKLLLSTASILLYAGGAVADGLGSDPLSVADENGFTVLSNATNVTKWGIGAGVDFQKEPYKNYGTKVLPLPLFFFDDKWVHIVGPTVDLKLWHWDGVSLTMRGKYEFGNVYSGADSSSLTGMHNRKGGLWFGPAAEWRTSIGTLSGDFMTGGNKGQQAHLQFSKELEYGRVSVEPYASVEWLSRNYVDYYYGVTQSEVRSGRSEYSGKSTENVTVGTRVAYTFALHQIVSIDLGVTRLGSSIYDSPIVGKRYTPRIGLAYLYQFE